MEIQERPAPSELLISSYHDKCITSFIEFSIAFQNPVRDFGDQIPSWKLANEFDRYKIWAGNVGAMYRGRRYQISLDYRLSEASFYRERVITFLKILDRNLHKGKWWDSAIRRFRPTDCLLALELVQGRRNPAEEDSPIVSAHRQSLNEPFEEDLEQEYNDSPWEISDSEGDGLVVSQSGSSAKPAFAISTLPGNAKKLVVDPSIEINSTARKPTMEMPHIIDEINFAITCLYKLPLRRPAPLDRFADHTLPDMSIYQHFDILYVKDKFPLADASLTMRLGKLVTRRRQLLFSRVGRDKRLTVNDDESRPINDGPGLPSRPEPGDLHTTGLPDMAKATPSVAPQSQASGSRRTGMTKATILRQENVLEDGPSQSFESAVSDYAPSMASSYATKLRVEVPDRPRGTSGEELDDFKCPYCLIICHVQSKDSWKKHVLRDLQPYSCTIQGCALYDHMFDKRDDWFQHERQSHNSEWACGQEGHSRYADQAEFLAHMSVNHSATVDAAQVSVFLSMFERPSSTPSGICSLCIREAKNLKTHLAHHLEQIALFALPRENEVPEMDSEANARGSIQTSKKSDQDDSGSEDLRSQSEWPVPHEEASDNTEIGLNDEIVDQVNQLMVPEQEASVDSSWAEVYSKTKPGETGDDRNRLKVFVKISENPYEVQEPGGPVKRANFTTDDLDREFNSLPDTKDTKLPKSFILKIRTLLRKHVNKTSLTPRYNDLAFEEIVAAFFNDLADPSVKKQVDRDKSVKVLISKFVTNATIVLSKDRQSGDDVWKLILAQHLARFVHFIYVTLDENNGAKHRPLLTSFLKTLESKILAHDRDLLAYDHRRAILQWLHAPDPSNYHQNARSQRQRQSKTGSWFIESKDFAVWRTSPGSFLWLHGIPGCGKTVLSSTVIEQLLQSSSGPPYLVLYYYFQSSDVSPQGPFETMVRSLLRQLLVQSVDSSLELEKLYASCMYGEQQTTCATFLVVLTHMLQNFGKFFIILDAVDECSERNQMIEWIKEYNTWENSNVHLLATSRRQVDINESLGRLHTGKMEVLLSRTQADEDARVHIQEILQNDPRLERWKETELQLEIENTLVSKANGMFLWVQLQLNSLRSCRSVSEVRRAMETLPGGLEHVYDRMFCSIEKRATKYIRKTLRWLTYSIRPLQLNEVVETFVVDYQASPRIDFERRMAAPTDLLSMCSGLVSSEDETLEGAEHKDVTSTVRLVHYSLREYLVSDSIRQGLASEYGMQEPKAQTLIANECLAYLLHFDDMVSFDPKIFKDFPLAGYAAKYWTRHAQVAETDPSTGPLMTMEFFSSKGHALLNSIRLYDPDRGNPNMDLTLDDIHTPLYYASMAGLDKTVHALLENRDDVSSQDVELDNALRAASFSGSDQVVIILLEYGADPNFESQLEDTALVMAASKGHDKVVRLLLEYGAHIDALSSRNWNALQSASLGGHDKVVEIPLDGGADVNAQKKLGGTYNRSKNALEAASSKGHSQVVKILLDHGADVSALEGEHSRALDEASSNGHEDVVQLLLAHGAIAASTEGYSAY